MALPPDVWKGSSFPCADRTSAPWSAVAQLPPLPMAQHSQATRVPREGRRRAAALQGGLRPQMSKLQSRGIASPGSYNNSALRKGGSPFRQSGGRAAGAQTEYATIHPRVIITEPNTP